MLRCTMMAYLAVGTLSLAVTAVGAQDDQQVVLQLHQASATRETREAMGRIVLENLAAQLAGRPPPAMV